MRGFPFARPERHQVAAVLLVLFAFSAWNLTGPAHLALVGLTLMFILDLPNAWPRLRRDPAVWLALGAVVVTSLLAWRGALLFPQTADLQWAAIWEWCAPFLFLVVAWWLRADLRLIHAVLIAAVTGLIVGVLRKSDWSLIGEILDGMRYYFGQSVLGIGFVTSVVLLGLVLYQPALPRARALLARPGPLLVWILWAFALLFVAAMLVVLQARGAVMVLVLAGAILVVYRLARPSVMRDARQVRRVTLVSLGLLSALTAAVLTVSWNRVVVDIEGLSAASPDDPVAWTASASVRLNLWRTGLELSAARPGLGWGPGTPTTEFLVPDQVIPFPAATLEYAPTFSHLHSVIAEMLVRFGSVGLLIALAWLLVLAPSARFMWGALAQRDPRLRELLALATFMLAVFLFYDFRILNVDLRFFMILYLGVLYSFWLHRGTGAPDPAA
jgi:O-antigen ligase